MNAAVTPGREELERLPEEILAAWRSRFPANMYAWPGAPTEFAIEAVKIFALRLSAKPSDPDAANERRTRDATIGECAKFVEQHQESISETSSGSERHLSPRRVGNLTGLAYVTGIRALSTGEKKP
jgi:hypothetical protein